MVTIIPPEETIYRGQDALFRVQVTDDRDDPLTIKVRWKDFNVEANGCNWVNTGSWSAVTLVESPAESSDAPYEFTAATTDIKCVCVLATDSDGAPGFACQRVVPSYRKPVAQITSDFSALPGASSFPLCGQAHVTGRYSTLPPGSTGDRIAWNWSGTDPLGNALVLSTCDSTAAGKPDVDRDRCFYTGMSGNYTVNLQVVVTPAAPVGTTVIPIESDPVSYVVAIGKDTPPCLETTSPDVFARQIVLPTCTLATCLPQQFEVRSVKDDCQPYPSLNNKPTTFVWSIYNAVAARWDRQVYDSNVYLLNTDKRVGDEVRLRLEVRDDKYDPSSATCQADQDICYDTSPGASPNCVRWTTWTVRFQ